jgi:hypothetical protein
MKLDVLVAALFKHAVIENIRYLGNLAGRMHNWDLLQHP